MGRQIVHCHLPTYAKSWPLKIQPRVVYIVGLPQLYNYG